MHVAGKFVFVNLCGSVQASWSTDTGLVLASLLVTHNSLVYTNEMPPPGGDPSVLAVPFSQTQTGMLGCCMEDAGLHGDGSWACIS